MDLTAMIIAYENDELDDTETIALFQQLVDNGMAWTLQGHYGRTAAALIHRGYVTGAIPEVKVAGLYNALTGEEL